MRTPTGRNRKGISISIDSDLADRIMGLEKRVRCDIVNAIFRDHLDDYISGRQAAPGLDNEQLRIIIREELSRLDLKRPEIPTETVNESIKGEEEARDLIDGFLGMREKK